MPGHRAKLRVKKKTGLRESYIGKYPGRIPSESREEKSINSFTVAISSRPLPMMGDTLFVSDTHEGHRDM